MMGCDCILAIDPGTSGAYALYWPDFGVISADDVPVVDKNIDAASLAAAFANANPTVAIIERVSAMPKQGVSSTFRFGVAYGLIQGIVGAQQIPVHFVTPQKWKKHFLLSADKEKSRTKALQLWPARAELFKRKKDHGRAEAALLAQYYVDVFMNGRS